MARKKVHEDHVNHEAWAIPYGDLITLLLAFFVVMYALSSVNEGKYRVLAASLSEAFGGKPRSISPIQLGATQVRGSAPDHAPPTPSTSSRGPVSPMPLSKWQMRPQIDRYRKGGGLDMGLQADRAAMARASSQLQQISVRVEEALGALIKNDLVKIRRGDFWLEVEIKSDILFASGSSVPQTSALPTLAKLADALAPFPNPLRIEGHTDNIPINTLAFPSNWELSSARAASVVHLFQRNGITPDRLAVIGYGEFRPREPNATAEGRNANRRVAIVILSTVDDSSAGSPPSDTALAPGPADNAPGRHP